MKYYSLLVVLLFSCGHYVFGQELFKDKVHENVNRLTLNYTDTLKADVYYVPGKKKVEKSPLVVLVHGGGFSSGKRDGELETGFSVDMAQRGYVVVSMEYHLTRKGRAEGFGCQCPAEDKVATFEAASENIGQLLNYIQRFGQEFQFDPGKVVLIGSSAGAEAVLHTAFVAHSSDHISDDVRVAAVVSFAGAMLDEVAIAAEYAVPAFLVHGTEDALVPYDRAPHHFCDKGAPGYLMLKGSKALGRELGDLKKPYTLVSAQGGGHEWANEAYKLTSEVASFIHETVIRGGGEQKEVSIAKDSAVKH